VVLRQLRQLQITQEFGQCAPAALQNYGQVRDRHVWRQNAGRHADRRMQAFRVCRSLKSSNNVRQELCRIMDSSVTGRRVDRHAGMQCMQAGSI
jgi:hypothetical protein